MNAAANPEQSVLQDDESSNLAAANTPAPPGDLCTLSVPTVAARCRGAGGSCGLCKVHGPLESAIFGGAGGDQRPNILWAMSRNQCRRLLPCLGANSAWLAVLPA